MNFLKKADFTVCPNCAEQFDYLSIPESGMGYIECPNCKSVIDQEGKTPEMKQKVNVTPPTGTGGGLGEAGFAATTSQPWLSPGLDQK